MDFRPVDNTHQLAHSVAFLMGLLVLVTAIACTFPVIQPNLVDTPTPTLTAVPTVETNASATPVIFVTILPFGGGAPAATASPVPATPVITRTPEPTETLPPTLAMPYEDASNLLDGVCFRFLETLGKQPLTFNSQGDLNKFYDAADQSKKCPEASDRHTFDFSSRQVVGLILSAQGCGFTMVYDHTAQDAAAQTRSIVLRVAAAGSCPYALIQPLLIAVDRLPGYTTQVDVAG